MTKLADPILVLTYYKEPDRVMIVVGSQRIDRPRDAVDTIKQL